MSERQGGRSPAGDKRHVGGELIIPVAALLFTLYYFTTIIDVPWTAQVSAVFVGSILSLCILIFIGRVILTVRRGEADFGLGRLIEPVNYIPKRIGLLVLTIGYIYIIHLGGFTLTTFAFLSLAMLLLNEGRRKGFILTLSAVLAISGWLLFIVAFETRFPEGPFEHLMKGLI